MKLIITKTGLISLFLFGSCGIQEPLSSQAQESCFLENGNQQLKWEPVKNVKDLKLQPKVGTTELPTRYKTFRIDPVALKAFFNQIGQNPADTTRIFLPLDEPPFCLEFQVTNSGTLSEELAQKYPELISLKGYAPGATLADCRIDFDGKHLVAEIRLKNKTYNISAWPGEDNVFYLLYRKADSGVEKKPFQRY